MIKQKTYKFRIRKWKGRVRSVILNKFELQNDDLVNYFSGDGNTQFREFSQYQEIHYQHIDMEKQLEISAIKDRDKEDIMQNKQAYQNINLSQSKENHINIPQSSVQISIKKQEVTKNQLPNRDEINPQSKLQDIIPVQTKQDIAVQNKDFLLLDFGSKKEKQYNLANIQQVPQIQVKQALLKDEIKYVSTFSSSLKSQTISLDSTQRIAVQMNSYWQNKKLILTQPIISNKSKAIFTINNLKYCLGAGLALKQIVQKHEFNYKSYENELSHGLFIITSQGYSWSHIYKGENDVFRQGFNKLNNGDQLMVELQFNQLTFTFKQHTFMLEVPQSNRQKYTLCFCAYLHEKTDSISIKPIQ